MDSQDYALVESASAAATNGDQRAADIIKRIGNKPSPETLKSGLRDLRDWSAVREHMNNPQPTAAAFTRSAPRGRDSQFINAAADAVLVRDGLLSESEASVDWDIFHDVGLPQLARQCLSMAGITPPPPGEKFATITKAREVRIERGHSTSDFDALMENIASKALTLGYDNAPETWMYWTRQTTANDFKQFSRISSPELPTMPEVPEGEHIPYAQLGGDSTEKGQISNYAELFSVSREAMVNDDTHALTVSMAAAGRAAARLVGDLAYGVLTDNAALSDGVVLFHATHANLVGSGSGAAPSVATFDAVRALMSAQTGGSGEVLNIRPGLLLVPTALESTACVLRDAISVQNDDTLTPGYVAGRFAVVSDARLDAASATGWYTIASPRQHSCVDIVTLQNGSKPSIESGSTTTRDSAMFRVSHAVAALAVDYRTAAHNAGA